MRRIVSSAGSRLVPALRYRDVGAAAEWLCGAFGFERQDVVTAVDGTILHARLTFGNDMILLLPVRSPDGGTGRRPEDAGSEMQSCYFVVDDADLHYRHAKAAGAEILDITEYDYGGRGYSCRDPEGHLWNFGTYDPRQGQQLAVIEHWPKEPPYWQTMAADLRLRTIAGIRSLSEKITPPVIVASVVAAVIAAATVGWLLLALPQTTAGGADKRLTFRTVTSPQPPEETAAAPPPVRTPISTLSMRPIVPQQSDNFEQAVRQQTPPAPPAAGAPRMKSAAFAAVGAPEAADDGSKEAAERNAEEALRQLRAAQRTAGEAFRQLREASAESAPAEPRRPQQQVARTTPDPRELQAAREQLAREQIGREQQLARERAAKEQAAALQEQMARERTAREAAERISAVSPPREPARAGQEQKPESFWDCQPSAETGQVVCNPKRPAAAAPAAAAPAPKPKVTAAEPAKAAAPPPAAAAPAQKADTRLWDCQPRPPTGEVVCRPMSGPAPAKQ